MNTTKNISLAISIILLAFGAWPIALITATVCVTLSIITDTQRRKEFQELQTEVRKLREDLEQLQTVRRAMDKVENRGEGR